MAIDNSLYDSLETTYVKMQDYFTKNQLGPEHSEIIVKHEELSTLLETLDIEALEEQSDDIYTLHAQLDVIKEFSQQVIDELDHVTDSHALTVKVAKALDQVFSKLALLMNKY